MINTPVIDNQCARNLFLHLQGMSLSPSRKFTKADLLDLITFMGFVQVDSIKTVERAHHMILLSRNQTYRPQMLNTLLQEDRSLFENWTHDASVIPSVFYPYWRKRFKRQATALLARWQVNRRAGFEAELKRVLRQVKTNGPVMARELNANRNQTTRATNSGWWDWHPSKTALEYLWRTGKLAVCGRQGFEKVYDLAERVIPPSVYNVKVSEAKFLHWACSSALDRLGAASVGEIAQFWGALTPADVKGWCQRQPSTRLITVKIESADGTPPRMSYMRPDIMEDLASLPQPAKRLRIVSPFDPVIRDRKRCQRLFDFDYRIEVFVPESQRRYGYYIFPLLERNDFIGRINIKVDRDRDALLVLGLWPEPTISWTQSRAQALDKELNRIRRYLSIGDVCYDE